MPHKRAKFLSVLCLGLVFFGLIYIFNNRHNLGHYDFFPIYTGLRAILEGDSPYGQKVSQILTDQWHLESNLRIARVVAYPYPLLVALLPLGLLPLNLAAALWFLLSVGMVSLGFLNLLKPRVSGLALPILFFPIFHAIKLETSSVLFLGLAALTLSGRALPPWMLGLFLAVLPLKPQFGLFLFVYAVFTLQPQIARLRYWIVLWLGLLLGISFILELNWVSNWWISVQHYRAQAISEMMLPVGLILGFSAIGLPGIILASILQVFAFPLNDLYSTIPLLFAWSTFRPIIALPGVAFSWLIPLTLSSPNSSQAIIALVALPLWVALLTAQLTRLSRYRHIRILRTKDFR